MIEMIDGQLKPNVVEIINIQELMCDAWTLALDYGIVETPCLDLGLDATYHYPPPSNEEVLMGLTLQAEGIKHAVLNLHGLCASFES